jgi:hypothetical protein
MAAKRKSSSFRPDPFDVLESRALLSGVHRGVELHSPGSTKQTIIQGTIRLQLVSESTDPSDPILYSDFSGRGTATHIGHVVCTVREATDAGEDADPFSWDTATLTTSKGETLAVEFGGTSFLPSGVRISGHVLGRKSTGKFAQSSGVVSGREDYLLSGPRSPTIVGIKLTFTIKLKQ